MENFFEYPSPAIDDIITAADVPAISAIDGAIDASTNNIDTLFNIKLIDPTANPIIDPNLLPDVFPFEFESDSLIENSFGFNSMFIISYCLYSLLRPVFE